MLLDLSLDWNHDCGGAALREVLPAASRFADVAKVMKEIEQLGFLLVEHEPEDPSMVRAVRSHYGALFAGRPSPAGD